MLSAANLNSQTRRYCQNCQTKYKSCFTQHAKLRITATNYV